ncbi:surface lipoprotein assembly modifier [Pasteurella caecimuris]|uniref:surface lipoprotein assembly modifier n=1 Tax=Rodentibacter caecimuris TaxID=1796644 RepID=UPI00214FD5BB|nr:surface lipoprotein assembly modifier [Pasteurella caecimuris]MCR1837631.1 surface lipoprotein assembly modifier [Pasteurella caecimuris]MCU0106685.1 surface lipoprotein assembly modifier [Pasteurella caecimuris]
MRYFILFFCLVSSVVHSSELEESLKQAIYQGEAAHIQNLLVQYQAQPHTDKTLLDYSQAKLAFLRQDYGQAIKIYRQIISERPELHSIRMELAIALFVDRQDWAARLQLDKVKSVKDLPASAYERINRYIDAINERNAWQVEGSIAFLKTNNVDNVSSSPAIENTGFVKNSKMLPQKATGVAYSFGVNRDFNLVNSHYLSVSNDILGKTYWDNHQFDDLFNRTLLGYAYKKNDFIFRIQPFFEKRWYGGEAFHWSNGIELSYSLWLSQNWQNQTSLSSEKRHFFKDNPQAGRINTISTTFIWYRNPKQILYIGTALAEEKPLERQYSSMIKNIRLGWLQEYQWGISTKLNTGFIQRQFKADAVLGGIIPLGKTRKDKIYTFLAQIWKRDWHLYGITPKLTFEWRKQQSNLKTLYHYKTQNLTIIFEKTF